MLTAGVTQSEPLYKVSATTGPHQKLRPPYFFTIHELALSMIAFLPSNIDGVSLCTKINYAAIITREHSNRGHGTNANQLDH